MIAAAYNYGPMAVVLYTGIAALIVLVVRRWKTGRLGGWATAILIACLCGSGVLMLAFVNIASQYRAQRSSELARSGLVITPPRASAVSSCTKTIEDSDTGNGLVVFPKGFPFDDDEDSPLSITVEPQRQSPYVGKASRNSVEISVPRRQSTRADIPKPPTGRQEPIVVVMKAGAFSVLLALAYLFLDAGRRQRYSWPQRLVVAAAFTALCLILWWIGPLA